MKSIKVNYVRDGKPTSTTVGMHIARFWAAAHGVSDDEIKERLQHFVYNQSEQIRDKQDIETRLLDDTRMA